MQQGAAEPLFVQAGVSWTMLFTYLKKAIAVKFSNPHRQLSHSSRLDLLRAELSSRHLHSRARKPTASSPSDSLPRRRKSSASGVYPLRC